jgi:hypothetical protein
MKKYLSKISFSSLAPLLHRLTATNASSNFFWRVALGSALVAALLIGAFAWLLYGEVTAEPATPISLKHNPPALSIDELRGVISFYQKKEEDFNMLHSSVPSAPTLDKGSGHSASLHTAQPSAQSPK